MDSRSLLTGVVLALAAAIAAAADDTAVRDFGGDRFVAGAAVTVSEPVRGDLIVAGGSIDVDAPVGGDAVLVGGRARLGADVAQSVYAAGGQVTVNGKVGRSVRVAGGRIEIGPSALIGGNLTVAGGQVSVRGTVAGHVQVGSGRLLIDGPVTGDVSAAAGNLELGPRARIGGTLRLRSPGELTQDPEAQVQGGIERLAMPPHRRGASAPAEPDDDEGPRVRVVRAGGWVWTAGLMLLAALLVIALPRFFGGVAQALRARPALAAGIGFAVLVCTPVAALVLLLTLVGAPLALLLVPVYLALLLVGYRSSGIALGDWALRRWSAAAGSAAAKALPRMLAVASGMLVVSLAARVPWIGGWIAFAALLLGLGALAVHAREAVRPGG